MNIVPAVFAIVSMFLVCCSPKSVTGVVKNNPTNSLSDPDGINNEMRDNSKARVAYISDRTYRVEFYCKVKDNVVVLTSQSEGAKPKKTVGGSGSGSVIRSYKSGSYILTAAHVVELPEGYAGNFNCTYTVQSHKHVNTPIGKLKAEIIFSNSKEDVAILKVKENLGLNSEFLLDPYTGEEIWSSGFPFQFARPDQAYLSITRGVLATLDVKNPSTGILHRVTSATYFGNSGGGVWNRDGKLAGVTLLLYGYTPEGGLAIPYHGFYYVKPISRVLQLLKDDGKYETVFNNRN